MKNILISGASRGIGLGILRTLIDEDAYVIGTSRSEKGASQITAIIGDVYGEGKGHGEILDVGDPGSITALADRLKRQERLPDVLINNAGIVADNILLRIRVEQWRQVMAVNLDSIFYMCKIFVRSMLRRKWGRIVNITSVSGIIGNLGQASYSASKAGVAAFSKSLAREVSGKGVTVNCVAPGFIDTEMTRRLTAKLRRSMEENIPLRRFGKPKEVAHAVSFLCAYEASYITGETINVNGGLVMT